MGGAHVSYNANEYIFQANTANQSLTTYSVSNAQSTVVGNLTQGSLGGLVGAYAETAVNPGFGELADLYLALPRPLPSISGFYPSIVTQGSNFAVIGNHFVGVNSVTINGTSLAFTVRASGAIAVTAPQKPVVGAVVVTSPAGSITSQQMLTVQ